MDLAIYYAYNCTGIRISVSNGKTNSVPGAAIAWGPLLKFLLIFLNDFCMQLYGSFGNYVTYLNFANGGNV